MKQSYRSTVRACYLGYITQAIIVNLAPLLFVIFQDSFGLTFEQVGRLILINFLVQITADVLSVKFLDKISCRAAAVSAHALSIAGLICLAALPQILPHAYTGLVIATVVYAFGGGLLEVLISPIVEAVPSDSKATAMSLLHSFYCWGQVGVVLITTLLIRLMGAQYWFVLPLLWAIIPFVNLINFCKVPLLPLIEEGSGMSVRELMRSPVFLLLLLMMMCSGAAELTMSQWASLFAERGLGVSKTVGDLLGPCLFAVLMGTGRAAYGIWGEKLSLNKTITACSVLCIICYLITVFSPFPLLSLAGCALCGLSVSMMWPGSFSLCSKQFPLGGNAMFALLAVFGDVGASAGPWLAGIISDAAQKFGATAQTGLKTGILICIIFPIMMAVGTLLLRRNKPAQSE